MLLVKPQAGYLFESADAFTFTVEKRALSFTKETAGRIFLNILWWTSLRVEVRLVKNRRVHTNITAGTNCAYFQTLISLVVPFVWTLRFLTNLSLTIKDVYREMLEKVFQSFWVIETRIRLLFRPLHTANRKWPWLIKIKLQNLKLHSAVLLPVLDSSPF